MCIASFKKVLSVTGSKAHMEDGRTVHLGPLKQISVGDYLEVYADIAVAKVDMSSRRKSGSAFVKGGHTS